jgi:hypothetical protein
MRQTKPMRMLLTASLISMAAASYGQVFANAGPAPVKADCCDDLNGRVSKLEKFAVQTSNVTMKLTGYIHRAVIWADNGFHSNTAHISPVSNASNMTFTGEAKYSTDLTFGAQARIDVFPNYGVGTSGTSLYDIRRSQSGSEAEAQFRSRLANVYMRSVSMGKLTLGRDYFPSLLAYVATDFSGTLLCMFPSYIISGMTFRTKGNSAVAGLNKRGTPLSPNATGRGQKFGQFIYDNGAINSGVRGDLIKYETPSMKGFRAAIAHSYQKYGDVSEVSAGYFGMPIAGSKFQIGTMVSYSINEAAEGNPGLSFAVKSNRSAFTNLGTANPGGLGNGDFIKGADYKTLNGAFGVLLPYSSSGKDGSGINLQVFGAHRDWKVKGQKDGRLLKGRAGYSDGFFKFGMTRFVADYGQAKSMELDLYTGISAASFSAPMTSALSNGIVGAAKQDGVTNGQKVNLNTTAWGLGVVQDVESVGTQLYLRYAHFKLKRHGVTLLTYKPVQVVLAGVQIKL